MIWLADTKSLSDLVDSLKNVTVIKRVNNRPSDLIGRYEKSVRVTVRPKYVIGRYEDFSKGCDWPIQRSCPVVRPKDALKAFDWLSRNNLSVWRGVRLVVLPDESDWTRREPFLFYVDATDWTLLWTCPAKNASDWPIRWWASRVFFGLLSHVISDIQTRWRENDYANASSLGDEYAVLICSWRQNRQN